MSVVHLKNLVIEAKHGVHDWEKRRPQKFQVNVEIDFDSGRAAISDKLEDTLDYSQLRDIVVKVVKGKSYNLIEKLAYEIARQLLADPRINGVVVSIDKLEAFNNGVAGFTAEYRPEN